MAEKITKSIYCEKCRKVLSAENFYKSNNLEKHPNGYQSSCKKCTTMHVDNWNPDTYLWILEDCDVPWVPKEWNDLMAKYAKDRSKVTGTTIVGRYLSKMKLKQYADYRWADTNYFKEKAETELRTQMKAQGYGASDIDSAIQKTIYDAPTGGVDAPPPPQAPVEMNSPYDSVTGAPTMSAAELGLTDEDILYLSVKWGKLYKPEEWVYLEKLYNDMMESYDIQTAGHIDTLKMICKTSLKCNQLVDLGDVEGFQKMSKVYNDLMKSGNFTAAQNKIDKGEYVDSISELVAICESQGFIPRYYTDGPQDKVDRVLQDMQSYTYRLIMEETNLSNLLENAISQIERDKAKEASGAAEAAGDESSLEDELFQEVKHDRTTEDYQDFQDFEDELEEQDNLTIKKLLGEEES